MTDPRKMDMHTDSPGPRITLARDLAVVMAMVACVITISAHGPSSTSTYAQGQQIGAVIGTIRSGNWLVPRDHYGGQARKGQLYAWLAGPVLKLTDTYNDFTFRLPTVVFSVISGVLVYFLGRRWYGARTGLLAACLWASIHHMAKLMYVAVTDMMVSTFILASILCADRLLFHKCQPRRRWRWMLALWATMILGGLSKGRGLLNLSIVGFMLAVGVLLWDGFGKASPPTATGKGHSARRFGPRVWMFVRLVGRRWWNAMKATAFIPGMAVTVAVLGAIWFAMMAEGGQEFRKIIDYEVWSRITGGGAKAPHAKSVPTVLNMLYYMLPVTVLAAGAMVIAGGRRWFAAGSPLVLPLCWIAAVVVPFSFTHAARHDYMLPCYPAGALMGAWAVNELLCRARAGRRDRLTSGLRHALAAVAITISVLVTVGSGIILFARSVELPRSIAKQVSPAIVAPETWLIFALLVPAGIVATILAVRFSLRWQIGRLTTVVIVGMLGVMFVERHGIARHARTGDGERLMRFGKAVRSTVGGDDFAKFRIAKLNTELYVGRFGIDISHNGPVADDRTGQELAEHSIRKLAALKATWLITCDKGLVELGAAAQDEGASYSVKVAGRRKRFRTAPELLGRIELLTDPVMSQRWGRAYLIRIDGLRLAKAIQRQMWRQAVGTDFESGRQ